MDSVDYAMKAMKADRKFQTILLPFRLVMQLAVCLATLLWLVTYFLPQLTLSESDMHIRNAATVVAIAFFVICTLMRLWYVMKVSAEVEQHG